MKRVIRLCLLAALMLGICDASAASKIKCKYVDASTLTIINKAQNDGLTYNRIDGSKYKVTESERNTLSLSTGLAITFTTNSRAIHARWTTKNAVVGANMTPILHSGLDLFIRDNGEWVFAGLARPNTSDTKHEFTLVKRMAEGEKESMLYLPMFNELYSLEIGIDEGATIAPMASPFKYKIMFVGSSLTHGASSSRPGACYVAQMGRILNAETPNIGMSGRCKLDDYFAAIVCDSKADAYIFDTFSNPTDKDIKDRLYNFVKRITSAHPDKPMIFLQTLIHDKAYFDLGTRKRNNNQREAAVKGMRQVCKEFKNVYFINPGFVVGSDHGGTVDGSHLNDLGVYRTLQTILPKVKKILKKYGIK